MTQIAIEDRVALSFAEAAAERGCQPGELASAVLESWMHEQELELTPGQQDHVLESIRQFQRGEVADGHTVMARFAETLSKIAGK